MEKIIYQNNSSKLIADTDGRIVMMTQYFDDEVIGTISMYFDEVKELMNFIDKVDVDE